jgi:tetratricopeptide (TPR) repeat protein
MPNTSDPAQQADTKLRQAAAAYDDAIDLLRDEPDRDERRGILYGNLGYVYLQLQEHDEAEQAYELALEYDTNLERQEQYNRALTQVRQARDDGFILATPTSPQKGE